MAFTDVQLLALEAAYASGVLTVRHGEKSVTYGSMSELYAAILRLRSELAGSAPAYRRTTYKGIG